jgi:flavin-dependent dehydrogenase
MKSLFMAADTLYDCGIIGGGLAGLSLAIQLAEKGYHVVVMEKNRYPFHKVCGEYMSMESKAFLENLGLDLSAMDLPLIDTLVISAHDGCKITAPLESGGFGISRHLLDHALAGIAKAKGVELMENTRVLRMQPVNGIYQIETSDKPVSAKIVCGSYGKITPSFVSRSGKHRAGKYIAVKYHIKTRLPDKHIELHNFKDGYCGISRVENDTYCLCYLTTVRNLKENSNSIKALEKNVLMRNPHLASIFREAEFLFQQPLAISQIGFDRKYTFHQDLFLLGDAAGAIAPLCGNGMSMAIHASKILAGSISLYLDNRISKNELVARYHKAWNGNFGLRIRSGYYLQKLFGRHYMTLLSIKILNRFPGLFKKLIRLTHGKTY